MTTDDQAERDRVLGERVREWVNVHRPVARNPTALRGVVDTLLKHRMLRTALLVRIIAETLEAEGEGSNA